jgi:5S rRNA maturation endonuclease (ribonuclease M5)
LRINPKRKKAFENILDLLKQIENTVDIILVEGTRDIKALRNIGYSGEIIPCSQIGLNDYELADKISGKYHRILILTDFDKEGVLIYQKFHEIFERKYIKVEDELRKNLGDLMSKLSVYAIESLDNIQDKIEAN